MANKCGGVWTLSYFHILLLWCTVAWADGELTTESQKRQITDLNAFCAGRGDGKILPDPTNCRAYILCTGDHGYRSECAPELYYDPGLRTCNYDNGKCRNQRGKPTGSKKIQFDSEREIDSVPKESFLRPDGAAVTRSRDVAKGPLAFSADKVNPDVIRAEAKLDLYCSRLGSGPHPHPDDCRAYVLCGHGRAFPSRCPDNLRYSAAMQGCDFDLHGDCIGQHPIPTDMGSIRIPETTGLERDHTNSETSLQNKVDGQPIPQNGAVNSPEVSNMMPNAIKRAMTELTDRLHEEAEMSKHLTDNLHFSESRSFFKEKSQMRTSRPFRLVQRFLRAAPLARQLSMSAFILNNAARRVLSELPDDTPAGVALLQSLGSPLPPSSHRLQEDEAVPLPEPGTCPWPRYNCRLSKYRSHDGSCNNLHSPLRGRSFIPLARSLPPHYGDGLWSPRGAAGGGSLPGARRVSHTVSPDADRPQRLHTMMLLQWGQFLDHDLSLTAITKIVTDPSGYGETADIECGRDGCARTHEACDPIRIHDDDPDFPDKPCLEFVRSQPVPDTNCSLGGRQQLNQITAYMDASNVYGSTRHEADALRDSTGRGGRLRMTPHPASPVLKQLLPQTRADKECKDFDKHQCFKAGDTRVNEQSALTVLHTMWARQHNQLAERLAGINPHWDDDTLFQETRRVVGALMQHITYNEFLPVVLGDHLMEEHGLQLLEDGHFRGYDSEADASITNVFSTAAFRFGHSLIPPALHRADANYSSHGHNYEPLPLSEVFFRPRHVYDTAGGGVDGLCRGLCGQHVQQVDRFVTKEVTARLFAESPPGGLGTDLVSLNIQRGRDHGLPGYVYWRRWCGLSEPHNFDDLTDMEPQVRDDFRRLYRKVKDIDLFPAGLAERSVEGGLVGPTFGCIIARQFSALRRGDRYWYENAGAYGFTIEQLRELRKMTLARLLCDNGDDIKHIQPRVMELPFREAFSTHMSEEAVREAGLDAAWYRRLWASDYNRRGNCSCLPRPDLSAWRDPGSRGTTRHQRPTGS